MLSLTPEKYAALYQQSIENPDTFWGEHGRCLAWFTPYTTVKDTRFTKPVHIKWFADGVLNACYNCLDRHLPERAQRVAYYVEGDEEGDCRTLTYQQLFDETCRMANVLKKLGVRKGDRVVIYLPMIPEAVAAMLACARIGAIHSVVFGGFSAQALAKRLQDCQASVLITANIGYRGGKEIPLKTSADSALQEFPSTKMLVIQRGDTPSTLQQGRDYNYTDEKQSVSTDCPCEPMNAEDPLFILYTSGSTGTPKGVLHTTGGYLVYASMTHRLVFDYQDGDIYWCTADVGWITGHSYAVYGPLSNGATSVLYEGIPTYPAADRWWKMIDRYKVTQFYTAPTAIRALMQKGDTFLNTSLRRSLRLLGSVGEPINPEAWHWYHDSVGLGQCYVVDTWWQTETGGILMTPLPHVHQPKPAMVMRPFFGVQPVLLDNEGRRLEGEAEGNLCLADSWPGQMRTVFGKHERFEDAYFSAFPNYYQSGDGARRDTNGDYAVTGRVDDVINVSGHRLGTAEIEAAIDSLAAVAESAVIGYPHSIKGQGIYAYIILKAGQNDSPQLRQDILTAVRAHIGAIATPDVLHICTDVPKTRSGKIMRRILRLIAEDREQDLGDISTLANPECVQQLLHEKRASM
jgi:acetyl-CoA synthetase